MAARPDWLEQFVEDVCGSLHAVDESSSMGCHYQEAEDLWEVTLFFSPIEVVGGEHDGLRQSCLYLVDTMSLLKVFSSIDSASWQPLSFGSEDDLKSHFAIVGVYQGQTIWLRVLAEAPEQIEPGRYLDHSTGRIIDTWA
ncbi:MAG TPA: hypothetical protein VNQ76_19340 [Planctomicrobium sp.]|nr:hypothetical protein [Planctomicrobium sp.]